MSHIPTGKRLKLLRYNKKNRYSKLENRICGTMHVDLIGIPIIFLVVDGNIISP